MPDKTTTNLMNDKTTLDYENKYLLSTTFVRISSVFALLLIIFSNFIGNLLNGTIKYIIQYYYIQHIVALLVLYFFVILVDASYTKYSAYIQIGYTISLYSIFILFTICEGKIAICAIMLLLILYGIHNWLNNLYLRREEMTDTTMQKNIHIVENTMGILLFLLLFSGVLIYIGFKSLHHKKNLSLVQLLQCESKIENIPFSMFSKCFLQGIRTCIGSK